MVVIGVTYDDDVLSRWGIVLSIISAAFTSTGLCLQKMHLKKLKSVANSQPSYSDTNYVAGISYVAIGLLLKAPICVMLPQVTIALMSAQTVLFSSLLEYMFLKNQMSKITLGCLVAIVLGIVVGVSGSTISDPYYSFGEIWDLFLSTKAVIFSVVCLACVFGISEFLRVAAIDVPQTARLVQVSLLAGLIAGLFGTVTKAVFEVLYYNAYLSSKETYSWGVWVLILPALALGVCKMRAVSGALREFPSWRFLPMYQSFAILMNCVCGLVYLDEGDLTRYPRSSTGDSTSSHLYFLGLLLVSGGVACLMLKHGDQSGNYAEFDSKGVPMGDVAANEDDEEEDEDFEEYHVTGGLNRILPGGVGEYYGVMFGRSAANADGGGEAASLTGGKRDYQAMFVGSMAQQQSAAAGGSKSSGGGRGGILSGVGVGGGGGKYQSYNRLPDQVDL